MSPSRPAFTRACYTIAELQELLGVGRFTVYRMLQDGVIPNIRTGRRFIVPVAAVTRMLESVGAPPAATETGVRGRELGGAGRGV